MKEKKERSGSRNPWREKKRPANGNRMNLFGVNRVLKRFPNVYKSMEKRTRQQEEWRQNTDGYTMNQIAICRCDCSRIEQIAHFICRLNSTSGLIFLLTLMTLMLFKDWIHWKFSRTLQNSTNTRPCTNRHTNYWKSTMKAQTVW